MAEDDDDADVVEEGTLYFTFRPKVETHDPQGLDDVERFHLIFVPHGKGLFRMAAIGRKRLPDIDDHERTWGFVEAIKTDARALAESLQEHTRETKTRGERTYPAHRAAGQAVYAFVQRGNTMHLVYALAQPETPGPVQKALNIAPEGSFAISVKNPEKDAPEGVGLSDAGKADYPRRKQKEFAGRRFAPTDPGLLDYEGAEFILIGAHRHVDDRLEDKAEHMSDERIFRQLRMAKSRHPTEPLFEGKWA